MRSSPSRRDGVYQGAGIRLRVVRCSLSGNKDRSGPEQLTGGIVGAVQEGLRNPYTHDDLPEIRDPGIVQPSGQPVDVPGERSATGPSQLDYQGQRVGPGQQFSATGPSQLGYQGQRIGPGQFFSSTGDVRGIQAGQQGQYGMQAGPGVGPSQTFRAAGPSQTFGVDPNSGRYQGAPSPTGFQGQGNSLEQATFQRGLNKIDPYLQEQREGISQRLQNQGLPVNSEAYEREMDRFDRGRGDALENLALSSVGAGRQEQGRLFGQDLASRQFGSGEAGRQFRERLQATGFNAQEAGRGFREKMIGTQFEAGEAGRGFREALASNQNLFGQQLSSNQFNAGESARRFNELSQSQGQEQAINLCRIGSLTLRKRSVDLLTGWV